MRVSRRRRRNQEEAGGSQQPPPPPPHKIYLELFKLKHEDQESTECFVERFLKLIYKLPSGDLSLKVQLDIVYSLLHERIQSRINRVDFNTYSELLAKAKTIEEELSTRTLRRRRIFTNISYTVTRRSTLATPQSLINARNRSHSRSRLIAEVLANMQDPSYHTQADQVDSPRNTIVDSPTVENRQTIITPDRNIPSIPGIIRISCRRCEHPDSRIFVLRGRGWFENAPGCGRLRGSGRGLSFNIPPCYARNHPLYLSTQASRQPAAAANPPSAQVGSIVGNLRGRPQRTPAPGHVCRASESISGVMRVQCSKCQYLDNRVFMIKGCGLRSGTSWLCGMGRGISFNIPPSDP